MNLKKVKRILAAALAVLLAVPTVSYGGVSEVHAEEASDDTADDTAEGDEYTLVTEIEPIAAADQNQAWFLGVSVPIVAGALPKTVTVHLSKKKSETTETTPDSAGDEESLEAEEKQEAENAQKIQQSVVTYAKGEK